MPKTDDLAWIDELVDNGLPDDVADDIRSRVQGLTGSTLRKERDTAASEASRYRSALLEQQFRDLGIPGKPQAYNLPADLDPTSPDSLKTWGTDMGFISPPAPDPAVADNLAAQQRIDTAITGAEVPPAAATALVDLAGAKNEAETLEILKRAGVTINAST